MKKQIIITGTSRGIGFELVKIFANKGYCVFALSRNHLPVKDLHLKNVHSISCDLSQQQSIHDCVEYISTKTQQIDILINNAGKFLNQKFSETRINDVKTIYEANVFGVFALTSQLIRSFKTIKHTVTVSSMGGIQGSVKFPGLAAYSTSKAAVICLTELLAEEYKDTEMAFNCLALGAVQTEMLEEAFPGMQAPVSAREMANYISNFAEEGHTYYNGKTLQVSNSTP